MKRKGENCSCWAQGTLSCPITEATTNKIQYHELWDLVVGHSSVLRALVTQARSPGLDSQWLPVSASSVLQLVASTTEFLFPAEARCPYHVWVPSNWKLRSNLTLNHTIETAASWLNSVGQNHNLCVAKPCKVEWQRKLAHLGLKNKITLENM